MKIFVQTYCRRDKLVVDEKANIELKRINDETVTYINEERVGIVAGVYYKNAEFNAEDFSCAITKPIKAFLYKYKYNNEYDRDTSFLVLFAHDNTLPNLIKNVEDYRNKQAKEEEHNNKITLINSINTMLKNNNKGCPGLCEDYWEDSIMEENFNWNKHSKHKLCPYDEETLFGCNAKSDIGCFYQLNSKNTPIFYKWAMNCY